MSDTLKELDLTVEEYREYEFDSNTSSNGRTTYRINEPAKVLFRPGGTTHRVVDTAGIAHCLPAPGHNGCVLRWKSKDSTKPVAH